MNNQKAMIRLLTSYYNEKNQARREELSECLKKNEQCKWIDEIIVLAEHYTASDLAGCDVSWADDNKIDWVWLYGRRPTFKDFFDEANKRTKDGDISIIANSDIFFDDTLKLVIENLKSNECYALSRWERNADGSEGELIQKFGDSQDVWAFKGKIEPIQFCDFPLAKLGCDNRIAHEIANAGYALSNPCLSIRTWHVHNSGIRNYNPLIRNKDTVVDPPYRVVHPSHLPVKLKEEKLRCLYIGMNTVQSPPNGLTKAFEKHFEVKEINTSNPRLNESIVIVANSWKPQVVFIQVQKEGVISFEVLDELQRIGCFVINFTGDCRENIDWYVEFGKHINLTVFTNLTDVYKMREFGLHSQMIELGIDPEIYTPVGEQRACKEIVFFGSNYGLHYFPLSVERVQMVQYMKKRFGERFGVYGTGWGAGASNLADGNFMLSQHEEAARYRGCSMAINYSHFDYDSYSSDRLTRILGTGIFCLCKRFINCETRFQDGVHLRYFDTLDELGHWTDYYSDPANKEEKDRTAKAGCELVHKKYKFEDLVIGVKECYEKSIAPKTEGIRTIAYCPCVYGTEFIEEAIKSVAPHVERILIFYSEKPSHGTWTEHQCPETEEEIKAIALAASNKVEWVRGQWFNEASQRAEVYKYADGMDVVMCFDTDEIFNREDLQNSIRFVYKGDKRNYGVDGYVNFWHTLDWEVKDFFRPIRFINLKNQWGTEGVVKQRVYHFGCSQRDNIMNFKYEIHGHKSELKPNWLQEKYYAWTPENKVRLLHPTSNDIWGDALPFDKTTLPDYIKQHSIYSKTI